VEGWNKKKLVYSHMDNIFYTCRRRGFVLWFINNVNHLTLALAL